MMPCSFNSILDQRGTATNNINPVNVLESCQFIDNLGTQCSDRAIDGIQYQCCLAFIVNNLTD